MYYTLLILIASHVHGGTVQSQAVVQGFETYELCISSAERAKVQFKAATGVEDVTTVCVRVKQ